MTERLRRPLQLAVAALIASAAGGLILVLLLMVATIAMGAGSAGGAGATMADAPVLLAFAVAGSGAAIGPAIALAWLPAFAAGAALWAAGRNRPWLGRRLAWALAGAAVASACYWRAFGLGSPDDSVFILFGLPPAALPAAFLLAGAAAGQVHRSAMAATAPFFGFDEDDCES
ncbi:MAG TPA: hypothetical protein VE053_12195 [Allosphingosinicella sp.]|nr:hypothetical protein [Allosphingosinicella sp.]